MWIHVRKFSIRSTGLLVGRRVNISGNLSNIGRDKLPSQNLAARKQALDNVKQAQKYMTNYIYICGQLKDISINNAQSTSCTLLQTSIQPRPYAQYSSANVYSTQRKYFLIPLRLVFHRSYCDDPNNFFWLITPYNIV